MTSDSIWNLSYMNHYAEIRPDFKKKKNSEAQPLPAL